LWGRGTSDDGHRLGYLLLMGNGTYDNRQLTTEVRAMSYPALLTWQSEDSGGESVSFVSDDIFGVLGDNATGNFYQYDLNIAVGRLPVQSVAEARAAAGVSTREGSYQALWANARAFFGLDR
jgi:hypothetical protein